MNWHSYKYRVIDTEREAERKLNNVMNENGNEILMIYSELIRNENDFENENITALCVGYAHNKFQCDNTRRILIITLNGTRYG